MQYDDNDEQMSLKTDEVWHRLMEEKVIQVRKVIRRIPKDELTADQLKNPIIASIVGKFGYYDFDPYPLSENTLKVLDFFVKLGYVNKSSDKIHKISSSSASYVIVNTLSKTENDQKINIKTT